MSAQANKSNKEINVGLIKKILDLMSPSAKESLCILSIPTLLSDPLAETLLGELGTSNHNLQEIIEEIHSFPIWHYRTKTSWAIDDDIRRYSLENTQNNRKTELMENVLRVLKDNYNCLEEPTVMNLEDYKMQILCLSSKLEKHVSEGINGFRELFNSATMYNHMEILRVIDLNLDEIFGENFSIDELQPTDIHNIYFMRGYYAYQTKKYDKAIKFWLPIYENSSKLVEHTKDIEDIARASNFMGIIWTEKKQLIEAESAFKKSRELYEIIEDTFDQPPANYGDPLIMNLSYCDNTRDHYKHVLNIRENGLTEEHTDFAQTQKLKNESLMGLTMKEINRKKEFSKDKASQYVTVILPAFNEEVSIGSIVLLARHYADHVVVVDDGSSDRTAEIAMKAGAEVIVLEVNKGKGEALKTGFTAAEGADIIVTMDSDGQHNPTDIPKLVSPILKGEADLVNGSRYLNDLGRNIPIYRRVGLRVLDRFTNLNSGVKITDSQSGFRAFSASTKDVFRFNAQGMTIENEMLADAGKSGLRIIEVGIGVRYDVDYSTISPIRVLETIIRDIEFNRPLYFFTLPGIIFGLIGIYFGILFLQEFSMGAALQLGPAVFMALLIVIGTFLTLTGIILHSIARNHTMQWSYK